MKDPSADQDGLEPAGVADSRPTGFSENLSRRIPVLASRVRAQILFMVLDAVCVVAGYSAAEIFYWRNVAPTAYGWHFALFVLIVMIVTLVCNQIYGLYGRMWRHAGLEEARQIILSSGTVAVFLLVIYAVVQLAGYQVVHPEVLVIGLILATLGMSLIRFQSRIFAWQRGSRGSGLRVAIIGSRDAAASAVREMIRHPDAGLIPVAVFDDDTSVHGMSLIGVPIVGAIRDIPAATSRYMLQEVLLAIPDASPEMIADVLHTTEAAGITMKVLPTVHDVVTGRTGMLAIRRAREPSIEDLLGRTPVATDLEGVRLSLENRRVLVTGAGGSIGSEICRQVAGFASRRARPPRPRRDAPSRHRVRPGGPLPAGPRRHQRPRDALRGFRALPPRCRTPHGGTQARSGARRPPNRGRTHQRVRDAQCDRCVRRSWGHPVLARLIRQGGAAVEHHGCLQASGGTGAVESVAARRPLLCRQIRQCPREPGQRHPNLRPPDQVWWSCHGDGPENDPLLHERRRSGPARAPGLAAVRGPRYLHVRDGRARTHHRPRPQDDPVVGWSGRRGHSNQDRRNPTR